VDVVLIAAKLFKFNVIALGDFLRNTDNGERDVVCQQCFAVLDGKDDVVVGTVYIVVRMGEGHASHRIRKPRFPDLP